jgi:hypothetical protein
MPAMLLLDFRVSLQYWEHPCPATGCDFLYRFTKRDGFLSWEPIDGYTVPDSGQQWSEPVDTIAVIERLIREGRPAA